MVLTYFYFTEQFGMAWNVTGVFMSLWNVFEMLGNALELVGSFGNANENAILSIELSLEKDWMMMF
jgi:hypothetical protein